MELDKTAKKHLAVAQLPLIAKAGVVVLEYWKWDPHCNPPNVY